MRDAVAQDRRPSVSFEVFPPRSEAGAATLDRVLRQLAPVEPTFTSVTYGAGGSTRDRTLGTLRDVVARGLCAAGHLTCAGTSRAEVDAVARQYRDLGIRHIVALRGDPETGIGTAFSPHAEGYRNAADLVAGLRRVGDFDITVAAYPERHPESPSWEAEIDNLKRKVDAGASRAITQLFFDNDDFDRFRDRVAAAGIGIPVVPGIATITSFDRTARFAEGCGATVPAWLRRRFAGLSGDERTSQLVGATVAAEQIEDLRRRGVDHFHLYTMNRAAIAYAVCQWLGLTPAARAAA